jgi:hypothetical protein
MVKASQKSIYCPFVGDIFCGVFYYTPPLDIRSQSFALSLHARFDLFD